MSPEEVLIKMGCVPSNRSVHWLINLYLEGRSSMEKRLRDKHRVRHEPLRMPADGIVTVMQLCVWLGEGKGSGDAAHMH